MLSTKAPPADREQVMDKLEERFGADQIWQVERLSRHIWRAWLRSGRVAVAIIQTGGSLDIRELEDPD